MLTYKGKLAPELLLKPNTNDLKYAGKVLVLIGDDSIHDFRKFFIVYRTIVVFVNLFDNTVPHYRVFRRLSLKGFSKLLLCNLSVAVSV